MRGKQTSSFPGFMGVPVASSQGMPGQPMEDQEAPHPDTCNLSIPLSLHFHDGDSVNFNNRCCVNFTNEEDVVKELKKALEESITLVKLRFHQRRVRRGEPEVTTKG